MMCNVTFIYGNVYVFTAQRPGAGGLRMSRKRKDGLKLILGGLFLGWVGLYFLGPAGEGVGVVDFLALPGRAWGMLFLMCSVVMFGMGIKAIIER
jgi:hypothetical protein